MRLFLDIMYVAMILFVVFLMIFSTREVGSTEIDSYKLRSVRAITDKECLYKFDYIGDNDRLSTVDYICDCGRYDPGTIVFFIPIEVTNK